MRRSGRLRATADVLAIAVRIQTIAFVGRSKRHRQARYLRRRDTCQLISIVVHIRGLKAIGTRRQGLDSIVRVEVQKVGRNSIDGGG